MNKTWGYTVCINGTVSQEMEKRDVLWQLCGPLAEGYSNVCVVSGKHIRSKSGRLPVVKLKTPPVTQKIIGVPNIVNIYTYGDYRYLCDIDLHDLWFNQNIASNEEFLRKHWQIIRDISRAEIIDSDGTMLIKTPFGITDMSNLSTSCKTVLNVLYLKETAPKDFKLVDITDASDEAINLIFEAVVGTNINLYLYRPVPVNNIKIKYRVDDVDFDPDTMEYPIYYFDVDGILQS